MTDADRVRAAVDALRDECVAFLSEIVRIPTVNPPGERYEQCAHVIGQRLASLGYEVDSVRPRSAHEGPPRLNVVARLEGRRPRPTLHFNGHFDVVPAGDRGAWSHEPFGGEVADGAIWGRGTGDQKAGIAASIFAIEAIRRAGIALGGSVEQSATVDEESGGLAGVAELCDQGLIAASRTDHVIITEPLGVGNVCVGHRGVYWCEITARGATGHGSMPGFGRNAADAMARLITRIDRELKPRIAQRRTALPVDPPGARVPSISLNALHAGQPMGAEQTPMVPETAVAVFDRRFIHEESSEDVRKEIADLVAREAATGDGIAWSTRDLMLVEPTRTPEPSRVADATRRAIESVLGREAGTILSPGTYDQKHVMRRGGVSDVIAYGPGILETAHRPDEHVRIDDLMNAAKVMALVALDLLGTG